MVVTRSEAVPVLRSIVVAPVTSTIRSIPTEIPLGVEDGLGTESVATFDNLHTLPRSGLVQLAGGTSPGRRAHICRALAALADC